MDGAREIRRLWKTKTTTISAVIGPLGTTRERQTEKNDGNG